MSTLKLEGGAEEMLIGWIILTWTNVHVPENSGMNEWELFQTLLRKATMGKGENWVDALALWGFRQQRGLALFSAFS